MVAIATLLCAAAASVQSVYATQITVFLNSGGTVVIGNTILNASGSNANIYKESSDTVISLGYNLSSDATGGDGTTGSGGLLNSTGDIRNTDPLLDVLADNGGSPSRMGCCPAARPSTQATPASPRHRTSTSAAPVFRASCAAALILVRSRFSPCLPP